MSDTMTSKERIDAVCNHDIPDRVPFVLASREFGMRHAGLPLSRAFTDPDSYIDSQLRLRDEYGLDAVWDIWATPIVDEAMGATMVIPEDDSPYIDYHPYLQSIDELDKLHDINPYTDGRMPYMLDLIHRLKEKAGPDVPVIAWVSQPFRTACMLRGEANLYRDMIKYPNKVLDLIEIAYRAELAYGKAAIDAGADIISTSNPVANAECISKRSYEKFSHPFTKRLFGELKNQGKDIWTMYHTCGKWNDRFDLVTDENVDIIHLDKVNLGEFKKKYADRVVACGNIHTTETLLQGTPESTREEAVQCLRDAKEGGRYILCANCAVPRDSKPENIAALHEVIEEYGAY